MAVKYRKDSEARLSVSELDGNFQYIEDELGNLSSDISQLEVIVESLDLAGLTASVLGLEGDVAGLTLDVASATASIAILNTNLASVTASITTLTTLDVLKEFKPGSVGEKVSFTKVSGTNPATNKDVIIPGELEITRGATSGGGIYNIAVENNFNSSVSPENTFWNTQYVDNVNTSWAPLWDIENRTYTNWRNAGDGVDDYVIPQYVGMPTIMKYDDGDTTIRYWLIMFTEWGVGDYDEYGFAYDRYEIFPSVYFEKENYDDDAVDIISEGVHIKRDNQGGLYNAVTDPDEATGASPRNTKWNSSYIDSRPGYSGWDDLSNLESRVYTSFVDALDGSVGNNINTDLVMWDMTTDLYYKIDFDSWTQGNGGNSNGGGFAYYRTVIPQSNGIKFADGTVMNTAPENGVTGDFNLVFFNTSEKGGSLSAGTFSFTNGILTSYSNIVPIDFG
jgi:hypothetical protein